MEWLAKNWFWVVGVLLILFLIFVPNSRLDKVNRPDLLSGSGFVHYQSNIKPFVTLKRPF